MPDANEARIMVRCTYAEWPGGGAVCARVRAPKLADLFFLVDHDNRFMELRAYHYGMLRDGRR